MGTVTAVSNPFDAEVTLNNLQFIRGCLKSPTITIRGFVQDATCGSGIPTVGDKIIVFLCEVEDYVLKVNQYVPFTGWVNNTRENLWKILARLGISKPPKCLCARGIEKCFNRENARCDGGTTIKKPAFSIELPEQGIPTIMVPQEPN